MASDKIKVAVRVRPFNRRELELGTQCVVEMDGQQTILQYPQSTHDKDRQALCTNKITIPRKRMFRIEASRLFVDKAAVRRGAKGGFRDK
ncbi:unnamed protein product [Danaus chrysippus]|uniref:(African queen) hypothetical protein n=1 Tax=Danaus chrysippus TaxID=151541 RepID=A0A8J2R4Y1_9NEOP|nr:unnamed protein product [Danaus chrysippus]